MTEHLKIVPGESIGPIKLGMTREQVEKLGLRSGLDQADRRIVYYPMVDSAEEAARLEHTHPSPGVRVCYDESDRCDRLSAVFGYGLLPPVFTLCGHVVNGMTGQEAASILRSLASDVRSSYGSIYSLSAGIRAIKWEASDEEIMCIDVMPRTAGTEVADSR